MKIYNLFLICIALMLNLFARFFKRIDRGFVAVGRGTERVFSRAVKSHRIKFALAAMIAIVAVQAHATLKISTAARNAELDSITTSIGSSGNLKLYNGTQPANCGTATTLLGTLPLSATAAPAAASGVLTFNAITNDSSADATSTATWFRVQTSGGTCVLDGTAGTSGTDLVLNTASIVTGAAISVSSFTITAGNS